eukprot:g28480.t1
MVNECEGPEPERARTEEHVPLAWSPGIEKPLQEIEVLLLLDEFLYRGEVHDLTIALGAWRMCHDSKKNSHVGGAREDLDAIVPPCLEVLEFANRYIRNDTLLCLLHVSMGCMTPDAPLEERGLAMRRHAALLATKRQAHSFSRIGPRRANRHLPTWRTTPTVMVKVTVGKAEDPWCEIELTEEDLSKQVYSAFVDNETPRFHRSTRKDWKKGVDITEEKFKEVIQLPPITLENCHEREDGDLQWDEITFEEEVNGKYWHAVIMALHRIREDFVKKQRKMKHLDWYMTMKKTSDKRNAKYYAPWL